MEQWDIVLLSELCDIRIGRTPDRAIDSYWGLGFPWLSISDMQQGKDLVVTKETITQKAIEECRCRQIEPGTLLMSFKLSVGKLGFARIPLYTNEAIAALPVRDNTRVLPEFLYYALQTIDLESDTDRAVKGITLNLEKLERILVPLPPLPEQLRLAALLDKADRVRRLRRYALELSETYLQSVFLEMFGDPVRNERGWEKRFVSDVSEVQGGLQVSQARDVLPLKKPYLRVANIYRESLDLSEIKEMRLTSEEFQRTQLRKGDVLIVEGHGNIDEIGRAAVWDGSIEGCVHQNHLIRVRVNKELMSSVYLSHYINSFIGREYFKATSNTTSGLNTTTTNTVKEFQILIPPLAAQQKFSLAVKKFERVHDQQREGLRQAEHLFETLLQRAFAGER